MPWIDRGPQPYTIQAASASLLLEFDGSDFSRLLANYPTITINLCRLYSQELREYHRRLSSRQSA
jgi:CRP-like cAMP-binding protein